MNRQSNDKYLCALDVSSGGKLFLLAFQLQALCAPTHIIFNWIFLRFLSDKQALKTYENRNTVRSEKVMIKVEGKVYLWINLCKLFVRVNIITIKNLQA